MSASSLRIAVVTPLPVSGVEGGNERHWRSLTTALVDAGYDTELIAVVSPEGDLVEVMQSYAMFHAMDLSSFDVVLSGKYPSFMVRHPKHIRHLNHPLRGLYEHYPVGLAAEIPDDLAAGIDSCGDDVERLTTWATKQVNDLAGDPVIAFPGPFARAVVQRLDRIGRDRLAAEAAVSDTVANRPGYVDPGRAITIIPPLGDLSIAAEAPELDRSKPPFLFTFGRLDHAKRFDLIIRSFRIAKRLPGMAGAELVVAGGGPLAAELEALGGDGVRVVGRLPDDELTAHLRAATAVVLAPVDEDYGLVAAEAMAAGTPIITTSDSGGIAEQVDHGRTGLVVHPKPALIGAAMRTLINDPDQAARMGRAATDAVRDITWQPMFDLIDEVATGKARQRALLVSTFPADPVESGGQRRLRGIAAGLHHHGWAPTVLSLTNRIGPDQIRRRRTADGVSHVMVGRSAAHLEADFAMASLLGTPVDDVAAGPLAPSTPIFGAELDRQLTTTDVVVLSHPFLSSALPADTPPVVYDSHNVETSLKARMFDGTQGGAWVADLAAEAEAEAIDRASIVAATSAADLDHFEALGLLRPDHVRVIAPNPLAVAVVAPRTADEHASARHRFLQDIGQPNDDRPIALFLGSNHPPNRTAAQHCHDLAAARPDLHIVIGGTVCSGTPSGGATELGSFAPGDLRRLHVMADVVLNPIEEGSGTSLKLIDALSLGIPVVSTAIGARGLPTPADVVWLAEPTAASLGAAVDHACQGDPGRVATGRRIAKAATAEAATKTLATELALLVTRSNS